MIRFWLCMIFVFGAFGMHASRVFSEETTQDADVQTQQLVGKVVSVNKKDQSFDFEYSDDAADQKKVATFFVTDITTIDIAMSQANLEDLKAGMSALVEYAVMPDGEKVVESVWVKKN